MNDDQLLRHSRHLLLDEIGIEGQARLGRSHAVIIGAGGLGSPAALYLGASGLGRLTLVDADTVDLTNLQRQIAHTTGRIGQSKVESIRSALLAIDPDAQVQALAKDADADLLDELLAQADVVLDCTDNFRTRHLINAACVRHRVPLVSGSAIRFDGQVMVIDPRLAGCACYACVFPTEESFEETRCSTLGVLSPLVGIIGSMQAAEALKLLAGIGESLAGRLLMLDALRMEWTQIRLQRRTGCQVCG